MGLLHFTKLSRELKSLGIVSRRFIGRNLLRLGDKANIAFTTTLLSRDVIILLLYHRAHILLLFIIHNLLFLLLIHHLFVELGVLEG